MSLCFSERLISLMASHNITPGELSRKVGISSEAIVYFMSGKCAVVGESGPSMNTCAKLASYFNVSMDYLTGFTLKDSSSIDEK